MDVKYCPVCNAVMEDKSWYRWVWDTDGEAVLDGDVLYVCPKCSTRLHYDDWEIAEAYRASEKQVRTARFIARWTGRSMPLPIKSVLWRYIRDYWDEAKKNCADYSDPSWMDDNWEWIPDYEELC